MTTNEQFLQALFKEDTPFVHVTDFPYDPGNIPNDRHMNAWSGNWFSRYYMQNSTNQYFTISIFNPDDTGKARRRKANFIRTPVIVLDDVREKLNMNEVNRLPKPSWILESSKGSEQWGYILDTPCHDRHVVENLLDGLVANGLAPDGKDPGMKGVTRYVRLPEGVNTKASKANPDGTPFNCQLLEWNPERTVSIEALAAPFHVNLYSKRREGRIDGASDVPNHPLLHIPEIIKVKTEISTGKFDIVCPWVDEHTKGEDNGAGVFTNEDGSIGFKCHHGNCQTKHAGNLLNFIDEHDPLFRDRYKVWKSTLLFKLLNDSVKQPVPDFMGEVVATVTVVPDFLGTAPVQPTPLAPVTVDIVPVDDQLKPFFDTIRTNSQTSEIAYNAAQTILQLVDTEPTMVKRRHHESLCTAMSWSKTELTTIIKSLQKEWYSSKNTTSYMDDIVYVSSLNKLYEFNTKIFYTTDAFQNAYAHLDMKARENALVECGVVKVDYLDFAPGEPEVFIQEGVKYANTYRNVEIEQGEKGDCSTWLSHWDALGWGQHRKHHLQWMAYTLRHPEIKINHIILLGGNEGTGKDFLLYVIDRAMGKHSVSIDGHDLLSGFNDYIMNTKYLHVNETELGDHTQAAEVGAKLKRMAAAPPDTIRVNQKGITAIEVRNIVNISMTTNSRSPTRLDSVSRRFHAVWSDTTIRDENDNVLPEWISYWNQCWSWMKDGGGYEACLYHLLNEVDLSDFNPATPPPMTNFLRDIHDLSKSANQHIVEDFIQSSHGVFKNDIITAKEAASTLRCGNMVSDSVNEDQAKWFTPTRVARVMGCISGCSHVRGYNDGKTVRLWIVRNHLAYANMTPSEIHKHYSCQK